MIPYSIINQAISWIGIAASICGMFVMIKLVVDYLVCRDCQEPDWTSMRRYVATAHARLAITISSPEVYATDLTILHRVMLHLATKDNAKYAYVGDEMHFTVESENDKIDPKWVILQIRGDEALKNKIEQALELLHTTGKLTMRYHVQYGGLVQKDEEQKKWIKDQSIMIVHAEGEANVIKH